MRANSTLDPTLLLGRARLAQQLTGTDGTLAPFVLLNAPAGYGKSILAQQLVASLSPEQYRVHWIKTSTRSQPAFWQILGAALFPSEHPDSAAGELEPQDFVLRQVTALREPTLMVIDAYHRVSNAETDLGLIDLCSASSFLHLLVLARSVRLLDGPLFADEVRTLREPELAFTADEISALAVRRDAPMHPSLQQTLALTCGWPLAASAVLNAESRPAAGGSRAPVTGQDPAESQAQPELHPQLSRLATDSLDLLDDEARVIMLAASVLETISLEQAAESLGKTEAEALAHIRPLLEFGLLAQTRLTHRIVYRAHPAVRATLSAVAMRTYSGPDRALLLRGSARERVAQDPLSAFRIFLETSTFAEAEEVLAAHFTSFTDRGEASVRLLRALPDDTLRAYPTFAAALLFVDFPDRTVAQEQLHQRAQLMHAGALHRLEQDSRPESTLSIAHRVQVMIGERMRGNVPGALALALELEPLVMSRAHVVDDVTGTSHPDGPGSQPAFLDELGFTAFMGGDGALARRVWQRLDAMMRVQTGDLRTSISPHVTTRHAAWRLAALYGLAIVEANDGDFLVAAEIIAEADALQEESGVSAPSLSWINGEVARAHLAYEYLDSNLLAQAIERVTPWNDRFEQWPMILMAEVEVTRYLRGPDWAIPQLRAGIAQIERARHGVGVWGGYLALYQALLNTTLGNFTVSGRILRTLPAENLFVQIERARLSLFTGENVRALLEVQKIGLAGISKRQRIDKFLIAAVSAWGCGQSAEAFEALRNAGELIERCGLSMMLRTVPFEPLREVAVAAQAAGVCDLVARIDSVPVQVRGVVRERLTTMEQRALESMVTHPSLAAAAELLSIAPATMKRHRLAVYRKLQVGGRDEAILQATRMGLLTQRGEDEPGGS